MKKILFLLLILPATILAQNKSDKKPFIQSIGLGTSFNAVADEGVWGVNALIEKEAFTWKNGRIYAGVGIFYGAFKVTSAAVNQYIDGRATLIQPIQLQAGHQFIVINNRISIRTGLVASQSIFRQKISFDDDRFDLDETYKYSKSQFTVHAKTGLAVRIGKSNHLEFYGNLPIVNKKIAPLGVGLGIVRRL